MYTTCRQQSYFIIYRPTSAEMMSKQECAGCTADADIEHEHDKVSLIVEADTGRREETVMVALQYTAVADLAVM